MVVGVAWCGPIVLLWSWNRSINDPNLVTFGSFAESSYDLWELPLFALLGVTGGLLGALFNGLNIKLTGWRLAHVTGSKQKNFMVKRARLCSCHRIVFSTEYYHM